MDKLSALNDQAGSPKEMQDRRDAWLAFQKGGSAWTKGTSSAWTKAQSASTTSSHSKLFANSGKFELMGNDVMEDKILSSRLALRLLDFASWELNDLRLRMQR